MLLAVLPVLALPGLAWGVGGRLAAADYPADWRALRAAVAPAPPGEVAALPWGTYRRLDWAGDRVVLDPLPRLLDRRTLADDALPLSSVTVRGEDPRAARVTPGWPPASGCRTCCGRPACGTRRCTATSPARPRPSGRWPGCRCCSRSRDLLLVELPGTDRAAAGGPALGGRGRPRCGHSGLGAVIVRRRPRLLRSRTPDERTGA